MKRTRNSLVRLLEESFFREDFKDCAQIILMQYVRGGEEMVTEWGSSVILWNCVNGITLMHVLQQEKWNFLINFLVESNTSEGISGNWQPATGYERACLNSIECHSFNSEVKDQSKHFSRPFQEFKNAVFLKKWAALLLASSRWNLWNFL